MSFDALIEKIKVKGNPTVMGIDPLLEYMPAALREGKPISEALISFCHRLIDVTADVVAAVKPQSAYFERYGLEGLFALDSIIKYARSAGLYVILDAKRGDIGPTAESYAEAAFGKYSSGADCLTVNPYLGSDGVLPFSEAAKKYDKSIFVLARTSNPSAAEFQERTVGKDEFLYEAVGKKIAEWGSDSIGAYGYNRVGAVAGATYPAQLGNLRRMLPNTFFLVPGYGSQGGAADDVMPAFDESGSGAVVNNSRGIMCAWKTMKRPAEDFADCAREAALTMRGAISEALGKK